MAATPSQSYAEWVVNATTLFLVWASMFTLVRLWAKLKSSLTWSLDNSTFIAAFVAGVAQCTTTFLAVRFGFGKVETVSSASHTKLKSALFASEILYILSIGLSKCSTTLFLRILTRNKQQENVVLAFVATCAVWTTVAVIVVSLRGNLASPWLTSYGSKDLFTRWLGIEASGLGLELILWSLCCYLLSGLTMRIKKKATIAGVLGFRLLLIAPVIGRLWFLSPSGNAGSTYANVMVQILSEGAMQYSLIADCLTCLKRFIQPFHSGWGIGSPHVLNSYSIPTKVSYAELEDTSRATPDPNPRITITERLGTPPGEVAENSYQSPAKVAKPSVRAPTLVAERLANTRVDVEENSVLQRQSSYSVSPPQRPDSDEFILRVGHASFAAQIEASPPRSYLILSEDDFDFPHPPQSQGIIQTTTITVQDEHIQRDDRSD